jgi:hypothetical protein
MQFIMYPCHRAVPVPVPQLPKVMPASWNRRENVAKVIFFP